MELDINCHFDVRCFKVTSVNRFSYFFCVVCLISSKGAYLCLKYEKMFNLPSLFCQVTSSYLEFIKLLHVCIAVFHFILFV